MNITRGPSQSTICVRFAQSRSSSYRFPALPSALHLLQLYIQLRSALLVYTLPQPQLDLTTWDPATTTGCLPATSQQPPTSPPDTSPDTSLDTLPALPVRPAATSQPLNYLLAVSLSTLLATPPNTLPALPDLPATSQLPPSSSPPASSQFLDSASFGHSRIEIGPNHHGPRLLSVPRHQSYHRPANTTNKSNFAEPS